MTVCLSCTMAGELTEGARCAKCVEYLIAAERERCAKVCEKVSQNWSANNDEYKSIALMCAEEIRKSSERK